MTVHIPLRFIEPDCPNADQHTAAPAGVDAWHEWAEAMARTHAQHRCGDCGRWTIWTPRPTNPTGAP